MVLIYLKFCTIIVDVSACLPSSGLNSSMNKMLWEHFPVTLINLTPLSHYHHHCHLFHIYHPTSSPHMLKKCPNSVVLYRSGYHCTVLRHSFLLLRSTSLGTDGCLYSAFEFSRTPLHILIRTANPILHPSNMIKNDLVY